MAADAVLIEREAEYVANIRTRIGIGFDVEEEGHDDRR